MLERTANELSENDLERVVGGGTTQITSQLDMIGILQGNGGTGPNATALNPILQHNFAAAISQYAFDHKIAKAPGPSGCPDVNGNVLKLCLTGKLQVFEVQTEVPGSGGGYTYLFNLQPPK